MKMIFKIGFFLSLSVFSWANQNTNNVVCSLSQSRNLIGYTNTRPFKLLANNSVQYSYATAEELLEKLKFLKQNNYCVVEEAMSCITTGTIVHYKGFYFSIAIDGDTFGITNNEDSRDNILFRLIDLGVCPKGSYKFPKN